MIVVDWNPLVNRRFNLGGDYGPQSGYISALQFESGKKRIYLNNSYIPIEYPSISLVLNNRIPAEGGKTEYQEFMNWFNNDLRYGALSFSIVRIGWKRKWYTKVDEFGIYNFIPESLKYDSLDGIVIASFGLEEIGIIPEIEHTFLVTNDGKFIRTNNEKFIAA